VASLSSSDQLPEVEIFHFQLTETKRGWCLEEREEVSTLATLTTALSRLFLRVWVLAALHKKQRCFHGKHPTGSASYVNHSIRRHHYPRVLRIPLAVQHLQNSVDKNYNDDGAEDQEEHNTSDKQNHIKCIKKWMNISLASNEIVTHQSLPIVRRGPDPFFVTNAKIVPRHRIAKISCSPKQTKPSLRIFADSDP
jgi:hypothetical protein